MAITLNRTGVLASAVFMVLAFAAAWRVLLYDGDSHAAGPTISSQREQNKGTTTGARSSLPSKHLRSTHTTTDARGPVPEIVLLKPDAVGLVVSLEHALKQIAGAENLLVPYSAQLKASQPEKVETLRSASSLVSRRVPMVADGVPTSAIDHGQYFWFSGGTDLRPIWDFSEGLAVRKSDGSVFRWKAIAQ